MYDRSGRACTSAMQIKQLKSLITSVQQWQEVEKEELDEKQLSRATVPSSPRCSPTHRLAFCSVGS